MQTTRQITRIRHLLNNNSLSFIIGAGFSQNMSDRFVDWSGLLKPIAKEMYNIDDDNDVWCKIKEIGYLGIAEEYVRRRGYHEAIDVYIEQYTPIIIRKESSKDVYEADEAEYIVIQNNETVDIADITCHKLLFDLDVKNIFTFNYDNCLDIIGNTDEADKLLCRIRQLQTELYFLEQIRFESNSYNLENLSSKGKISPVQESIAVTSPTISTTDFDTFIERLKTKFPSLSILNQHFTDNVAFNDKIEDEITLKGVELSSLQKQRESCYQLISTSGMLSLTDGKKNIFKLHGTIRLNDSKEYGFDGDSHCNYIITATDYIDYPIKHEPFVDYMKISLLKGAFCLIGFSGDDPNFLSWMSWVKEVIDKNPEIKMELSQENSARFFYIHSGNNPLPKDKRLLLKNHYIEYVELSKIFTGNSHKDRIKQFLEYLSPKTSYFSKEKWNLVCENLYRDYPYPCLFYSLQYNSPKLTTSISQKILYCDDLKDELPRIVKSLFTALRQKECPENYRQSIMQALPILLIGVRATIWNKNFISFFNKLKPYNLKTRKYDDINYTHEDFYKLISFGLTWTSDKKFKIKIISDILKTREKIGNWENSLIIDAMHSVSEYDLFSSQYIDEIRQELLWLCKNGNQPPHIYVILNLIKLIDKQYVKECLERLPNPLIESDCTLMKAIPNFIQPNSPFMCRIKRIILKSHFLWYNGINNGCISLNGAFLDIAYISNKIDFTNDELLYIWEKMKFSLSQIQKEFNKRSDKESLFFLSHFDGILDEMKLFIENNTFKTISKEEYDEVYNIIIKLRIGISSNTSHNISELLIEDHTNSAISMLVDIRPEERFTRFQAEYILLANKIVLKQSQYLNSCMKHFSWIVGTYSDMIPQVIFKPILRYILISYTQYFNGEKDWDISYARKDEFEKGLLKIYSTFRDWGGENSFWESYKPRFFNV